MSVEKWQYHPALGTSTVHSGVYGWMFIFSLLQLSKTNDRKRSLSFWKLLIGIKWDILQCLIHHCPNCWHIYTFICEMFVKQCNIFQIIYLIQTTILYSNKTLHPYAECIWLNTHYGALCFDININIRKGCSHVQGKKVEWTHLYKIFWN